MAAKKTIKKGGGKGGDKPCSFVLSKSIITGLKRAATKQGFTNFAIVGVG